MPLLFTQMVSSCCEEGNFFLAPIGGEDRGEGDFSYHTLTLALSLCEGEGIKRSSTFRIPPAAECAPSGKRPAS